MVRKIASKEKNASKVSKGKNAKPATQPKAACGFSLGRELGTGGATRYYLRHTSAGEVRVPLTRFLRLLGAAGWGYPQTAALLADVSLPIVSPVTREDISRGEYAEGTTPNTVRSQLHSGRAFLMGVKGENVSGNNRLHHGTPDSGDAAAFRRKAIAIMQPNTTLRSVGNVDTWPRNPSSPRRRARASKQIAFYLSRVP